MTDLKKTLEFYANEDNHDYELHYDMCEIDESEVMKDYGVRAKTALSDPSEVKNTLKFYANEENHEYEIHYDMCEITESEVMKDLGKKARESLASL